MTRQSSQSVMLVIALLLPLAARGAEAAGPTDEQKRQYRTATTLRDEAARPLLGRQRDELAKVREMIEAGKPAAEIQRQLGQLKLIFGELKSVENRYEASLAKVLTPQQRAKLIAVAAATPKKTASIEEDEHE